MWTDREQLALLEIFESTTQEIQILLNLAEAESGRRQSFVSRNRRVCEMLHKTLTSTKEELKLFGTTRSLHTAIRREAEAISQEKKIVLEEKMNRAEVKRRQEKNRKLQKTWKAEEMALNEKIANAQDLAHDTEIRIRMEEIYNEKLLAVMAKSNAKGIAEEEAAERQNLEKLQCQILDESHAHTVAAQFLKDFLKELESQADEWRTKYDRNMTMMQKEIDVLSKNCDETTRKLEEQQKLLEERTKVVHDYQAEKEREALEILRKQVENQAAVRIQSWWRGMMVRHKLGPYKPKRARIRKKATSPKSDDRSVKSSDRKSSSSTPKQLSTTEVKKGPVGGKKGPAVGKKTVDQKKKGGEVGKNAVKA